MSRKQKAARSDSLEALLDSGDHRAAAREARSVLADPNSSEERRSRAGAVLRSLAPEPLAFALGLLGVAAAAALSIWTALGGAR